MTTAPETKENKEESPKLWAGKYKTPEELEEGYKRSLPLYQENENLKKQLEDVKKVPDDYLIPKESNLSENDISELKSIAKNAEITQTHFDKLILDRQERNNTKAQQIEETKKSLGEEKINIINDYIKKHYPEKIGSLIMNQIISDKDMLMDALNHRDKVLNSSVPGTSKLINSVGYKITKDDLNKAALEIDKAPYDKRFELEKRLVNLTSEFTRQQNQ